MAFSLKKFGLIKVRLAELILVTFLSKTGGRAINKSVRRGKKSQKEYKGAKKSQKEPKGAKRSQKEPKGAKRSQEKPVEIYNLLATN